jgi:hypothetical protein
MQSASVKAIVLALAWVVGIPTLATILTPVEQPREAYPLPRMEAAQATYDQKVEETFGLKPGTGKLITESEWANHERNLWVLSPEDQAKYRLNVRQEIAKKQSEA